jgi:ankyrin repeat protein
MLFWFSFVTTLLSQTITTPAESTLDSLTIAIQNRDTPAIVTLLKRGSIVNEQHFDALGVKPDTTILKLLLENRPDSAGYEISDKALFFNAKWESNFPLLVFWANRIKLDEIQDIFETFWHKIVSNKIIDTKYVDFLIKKGVPINQPNYNGMTILHYCCDYESDSRILELFLKAGANPNAQNLNGLTPLHIAVKNNDIQALQLLKSFGARLDIPNKNNQTPLDYLLEECMNENYLSMNPKNIKHIESVLFCLVNGAPIDNVNSRQWPDLFYFCQDHDWWTEDQSDLVKKAFTYLAPDSTHLNYADKWGNTALHVAAQQGNLIACSTLIYMGIKVNAVNKEGFSPLHCAIDSRDIDCLSFLLHHGSDIVNDSNGRSLLFFTYSPTQFSNPLDDGRCRGEKRDYFPNAFDNSLTIDIMNTLLQYGIPINQVDSTGHTILDFVIKDKNTKVSHFLLKKGGIAPKTKQSIIDKLHNGKELQPYIYGEEKPIALRIISFTGNNSIFSRVALTLGEDFFKSTNDILSPRLSFCIDIFSTGLFMDKKFIKDYGIDWLVPLLDLTTIILMTASSPGSAGFGGGYVAKASLMVFSPLWIPSMLSNFSVDYGLEPIRISLGWNTDYFIGHNKAIAFFPHLSIKGATPQSLLLESGITNQFLFIKGKKDHNPFKPMLYCRIGFGIRD